MSRKAFKKSFKKRKYYFTDRSISTDTIISFTMGGIALAIELAGAIASIMTKGNVPAIFGYLFVCAFLLSVVGFVFSGISRKDQRGGVKSKMASSFLCVFSFLIVIIVVIVGLI